MFCSFNLCYSHFSTCFVYFSLCYSYFSMCSAHFSLFYSNVSLCSAHFSLFFAHFCLCCICYKCINGSLALWAESFITQHSSQTPVSLLCSVFHGSSVVLTRGGSQRPTGLRWVFRGLIFRKYKRLPSVFIRLSWNDPSRPVFRLLP